MRSAPDSTLPTVPWAVWLVGLALITVLLGCRNDGPGPKGTPVKVGRGTPLGPGCPATREEFEAGSQEKLARDAVRVSGKVVAGSFETRVGEPRRMRFQVQGRRGPVEVHFDERLPDAFDEGRTVLVSGQRLEGGAIQATRILVKCPENYRAR